MADRWRRLRTEPRGDFRVFRVHEDFYDHPDLHGERSFFVVRCPDWVNVLALTSEREIVFIRQFRPGVGAVRLEIPGGIVEPGEEPAATAARELLEETGYRGGPPQWLCTVEPNPALQDNRCHSFLVRDAVAVQEAAGDGDEVIQVQLEPRSRLSALLREGRIEHALIRVALLEFLMLDADRPRR
ncbi:MAG: NUDIX hydrolase [Planctomycetota bacterium]|nr:MAG: NUDIX hydrolase [Planctomycetota bacterium]